MSQAKRDIERCRVEQDLRHGGPSHDDRRTPYEWLTIIEKYLGRAADATPMLTNNPKAYREAMIAAAAVAQAAIESFDRKGGF